MNPKFPTVVTAEASCEAPIQRVAIDTAAVISDPDLAGMLETIDSIDRLEPVRDELADRIKARLLSKRAKFALAQDAGIQAEIKLNDVPRVLSTDKVLYAIDARAKEQSRELLDMLLEMGETLKFGKAALEEFFSKNDIDALCDDGKPSAPSLIVKRLCDPGPSKIESAIKTLGQLARKLPKLFILPERKRSKAPAGEERTVYFWAPIRVSLRDFYSIITKPTY